MSLNHLVVLPIVLPAITAGLLLLLNRHPNRVRQLSVASVVALLAVAIALFVQASTGSYQTYALSDWSAPFGIVMVVDRLSALLVLITAVVGLAALFYAAQGWDTKGKYFHVLFQFQLMGINGAFLTGDLFNLFVFFEVLLIASYCLLLHGLGQPRLRAAVHYVAINLTGSAVFLIAVSLLYSVTGTLNMAHVAERVAQAPVEDIALIRSAGLMLLGVFGVKAALFPLYFWLPAAYSSASAPVAALFAVMTKVGVYAILRVTTLIYGGESGAAANLLESWMLPVALLTLALAAIGALAAKRLTELIAYLTVASVGTMLVAISAGGVEGLSGALFYLMHSTLIVAAMFLLAEILGRGRGTVADMLTAGPHLLQPAFLSISFLLGGAILAGLPLSAGFLAKLMILKSVADAPMAAWAWAIILGSSLLTLIGLARAGSLLIWKTKTPPASDAHRAGLGQAIPFVALLACSVLLVVFAVPVKHYADATAQQLFSPKGYMDSVLSPGVDRAPRPIPGRSAP
jgi:multicomponent K+:H+ antiporter subunit D